VHAVLGQGAAQDRIGGVDAVQGGVGEHHAEAERVAGLVALVHGDFAFRVAALGQQRGQQAARAAEQLPAAAELAALPGAEALRLQVELVASYRALPFRDPDLPAALLPEGWPSRRAHTLFTAAHDALHGPADAFVRDIVVDAHR